MRDKQYSVEHLRDLMEYRRLHKITIATLDQQSEPTALAAGLEVGRFKL